MIVDKAGELIADVMTADRSLALIPSASAILDTSNYTFQAITYGKDADGFRQHAHVLLSPSSNGIIKVVSYQSLTVSSYQTSATALALGDSYKILPQSPLPTDTRLESRSTLPYASANVPDVGHCLNSIIDSNLSSLANVIGCFPASGGTQYWVVSSSISPSTSILYSGTLISAYNKFGIMDSSGFLKFADLNASASLASGTAGTYYHLGAFRLANNNFPKDMTVGWYLPSGDAGSLLLFGGLYHIGLWVFDLKEMLRLGYSPPFNFNNLNNNRRYKLFAKHTFNKDLLYLKDSPLPLPGFKTMFESGLGWAGATFPAIVYSWKIRFA